MADKSYIQDVTNLQEDNTDCSIDLTVIDCEPDSGSIPVHNHDDLYYRKPYIDDLFQGIGETAEHNKLEGLQGGEGSDEFYHVSEDQYDALNNPLADNDNKFVTESEVASKTEIDDETISEDTTWSSFKINDITLEPWTDSNVFTYDGTNNIQTLSFIPKAIKGVTTLNGVTLDPYYDFYFEDDTIVLLSTNLTEGIEYKLITYYFK